jgi:isoquinoline 1-oxidoreductase/isoquinoline 1-oxidoreductase beta subunit
MMELTRRTLLAGSGLAAGGLALGFGLRSSAAPLGAAQGGPFENHAFDAWLQITSDDRIVLQLDRVEMGQGTTTGLATLLAEELEVDPRKIDVRPAPVHERFQHPLQITGGSTSVRDSFEPLRRTGARAREMLKLAAAERLGVPAAELRAENGAIVDPRTGASLRYGELAAAASGMSPPEPVPLKPPESFRWIGRDFPRLDAADKVRGAARFGIDTRVPGMRSAVVVRSPHLRGRLLEYDAEEARTLPGVLHVLEIPSGIAVVATSYWRARRAASAIRARFDPGPSKGVSSAFIRSEHRRRLAEDGGNVVRNDGDARESLGRAPRVLEAEYYAPYLAHATMEPMNCTVVPGDGRCDVYVATQGPDVVQDLVAGVMGCSRSEVHVHTTLLGGGFGRRGFPDYAVEAAHIARKTGLAIQLIWSREDDMAHDFYRPAVTHRLRGALDGAGRPLAWEHRLIAPNMLRYVAPGAAGVLAPEWLRGAANLVGSAALPLVFRWLGPVTEREGSADLAYSIENVRVETLEWDPGIPVGFWRSVGHSHNAFAVESFVDELAHAAGRNPADLRRELLAHHPRHLAVLALALEKSGYGRPPAGRFQGLAVHESFGSVVAEVAQVSVDAGAIRVHRVTCAVDCGLAVNPDIVRAQMESGIVYGLTAALRGEITFEDGAAQQSNFHDYPLLRMSEVPAIDVHIAPSAEAPTGVGEPGTPPIAPAVANAVFAATGQRLRELPLRLA